jgi:hypothetical protein
MNDANDARCASVKDGGASFVVEFGAYEREDPENSSDANWISARVDLRKDAFNGSAAVAFTTQDLQRLQQGLTRLLNQERAPLEFTCEEEGVSLSARMGSGGVGEMSAVLRDDKDREVSLRVRFSVGRPELEAFASRIDRIVAAFPVRSVPG